ncbi:MAG: ferritin-like domain-containing protein [Cytophagaceae bacterium]|nr:ferritin-like domain-containing protein [Cytophagaceae bacterium]
MNKLDLEKVDQEEFLKPALRRNLFKKAKDFSLKAALTSIPFALVAMPTIVKAQTANSIAALQLALKLEYLERKFYQMGQAAMVSTALPSTNKVVFDQIYAHEADHVTFLATALGAAAPVEPTFDFTVGGTYSPFTDYPTFLAMAQAFEDTGVRAYKGQAGNLMADNDLLTAALQIHSVEARHASEVRRIRNEKGWITQNNTTIPAAFAAVYSGATTEANTTHAGVNIATAISAGVSNDRKTEAFDEVLTTSETVAIFNMFCTANC